MDADGKVAIVTGGASGLGAAAVDALRESGASVCVLARGKDRERFTAGRPGTRFLPADVTDPASVQRAVEHVLADRGRIDILVHCAGIGQLTPVVEPTTRQSRASRGGPGYLFEPTVVSGLRQDDEMIQEEIFGPVITVQTFSDEDQTVRWANGVRSGLASSVWTVP